MSLNPASEIKQQLDALIIQIEALEPRLARRLRDFRSWIGQKKDGLLTSKPEILEFLRELIEDCKFWIIIHPLSPSDRIEVYDDIDIPLSQRYWFDVLFPAWFQEPDPKSSIWKKKMMAGDLQNSDDDTIAKLAYGISSQGGNAIWRYILDLSMATDLLIAGSQPEALCVQLTSVQGESLADKSRYWRKTLKYWNIPRGLLLSYSLTNANYQDLARVTLEYGDTLAPDRYTVEER